MDRLTKCMGVASGKLKADIALKNAWVVDVFTQAIHKDDIAIVGDEIVGIGRYHGKTEVDCEGCYVAPGFIDAHVHVESSKMIPEVFSRLLIKNGVTTCIADPHEIANVLGEEGIEFMIENSRNSAVDIFFMMPSCVPAVDFEDNGAILNSDSLKKFAKNPRVIGLGEVMDVPAVLSMKDSMRKKLNLFRHKVIDGHCPGISNEWLNAYIYSGIKTDHECTTIEQAQEELKRGMYVMLREGSAARNLLSLLPAVDDGNFHRFLFCTDDKDITDLEKEGSINYNIKISVKNGLDPVKAVTIATLNAARCYGLRKNGAVAPGYKADLVVLNNLKEVDIKHVIRKGRVYEEGVYEPRNVNIRQSMNIDHVREDMFRIKAQSMNINVIKIIKNSIITKKVEREVLVNDGTAVGIKSPNAIKIAVFERHKKTGKYALGFIEGLGIKNCTVAQTIAHDSHNIIVAGDNDKDMEIAVNRVIDMGGGIVIVSMGKIAEELGLTVAGLMTYEAPQQVIEKLDRMNKIIKNYERSDSGDIFLTLSFMSLPVIPEIKITARGLFDFNKGDFISLFG